jgi:hypothetical protein
VATAARGPFDEACATAPLGADGAVDSLAAGEEGPLVGDVDVPPSLGALGDLVVVGGVGVPGSGVLGPVVLTSGVDTLTLGVDTVTFGVDTLTPGALTPTLGTDTPTLGTLTPTLGAVAPMLGTDTPTLGTVTPTLGTDTLTLGTDTLTLGKLTLTLGRDAPALGADTLVLGVATAVAGEGRRASAFPPASSNEHTPRSAARRAVAAGLAVGLVIVGVRSARETWSDARWCCPVRHTTGPRPSGSTSR